MRGHVFAIGLLLAVAFATAPASAEYVQYWALSTHPCTVTDCDGDELNFDRQNQDGEYYHIFNGFDYGATDLNIYETGEQSTITANEPQGLRFKGWWPKAGGNCIETDKTISGAKIKTAGEWNSRPAVLAKYVPIYEIKTAVSPAGTGTASGAGTYEEGEPVRLSSSANEGYALKGWEKGGRLVSPTNFAFTAASGCAGTYTAVFTGKVYAVTLSAGYDDVQEVAAQYGLPMPTLERLPSKYGYDFDGFYAKDGKSGTQYYKADGTSAHVWDQAKSTTIFAAWTPRLAELRLTLTEGVAAVCYRTGELDNWQTNAADVVVKLQVGTMVHAYGIPKEGYRIADYDIENQWEQKLPADGKTFSPTAEKLPTVYAVVFADPSGTYAAVTEKVNEGAAAQAPDWSRKGYGLGWDRSFAKITSSMTVNAVWTPVRYMIRFDANGGTGEMNDLSVDYGSEVALPPNAFENTPLFFDHWTTTVDTVSYPDGAVVSNLTTVAGETNVFFAVWKKHGYKVRFFGNGGTNTMSEQSFDYGTPQPLRRNAYVRDGFSFAGWATDPTNGVAFSDESDGSTLTTVDGATVPLYAKWTANGGEVTSEFSKALDCDNVEFRPKDKQELFSVQSVAGARDGTCVKIKVEQGKTKGFYALQGAVPCGGRLSFSYRTSIADSDDLTSQLQVLNSQENLPQANDWTVRSYTFDSAATIGWGLLRKNDDGWDYDVSDNDFVLIDNVRWEPAVTNATTVGVTFRDAAGGVFDNVTRKAGEPYGELPVPLSPDASGREFLDWECEGAAIDESWQIPAVADGVEVISKWSDSPTPPEPVVTNAVPVVVTGLVYDGTEKTGVPAGANYTIVGNVATNAGSYTATATVTNGVWKGGFGGATNIAWTIAKATIDMSGVTFESATYEFDGEEHSIAVAGVPTGVEVVYSGDPTNRTEVGTNTVTASFKVLDDVNYEAITTTLTAKLIITPKDDPGPGPGPGPGPDPELVVTNDVPTAIAGLVYDGTEKLGIAAGANYAIVGNVATNAGDYVATATVTNGVWKGGFGGATNIAWTIAKATVDMSGVTFASATYEWDGAEHSIAVAGVPSGVEVVYSGDATNRTEIGTNTVTASFKVLDDVNYEAITKTLTATLAITPKDDPPPTPPDPPTPVVTNDVPTAIAGLVYDGTEKLGVASGANYTIVGNVGTNAGDYVAKATVTNGVWEGGATGATNIAWTIAKATVDMSGVSFASATYEWDGAEHSIAVAGVPDGVEVVYSGDATNRTEIGTNTVTASFTVLDELNYNAITNRLTATLAIVEPPPPPDPTVAYENIYFKATLAELGAEAVPTNRKITIKAEGLPKGLKLVTTALKDARNKATGHYAYTVEGAPTETMDGLSRMAYVRVTDDKVQTLYALDLSVLWAKAHEDKSFPDGEAKSKYANFSVTNLWSDIAKNPKNWTFSGWPAGIKYATKAVTSRKKVDGVYVTVTNARPYEIYGTPTKAGRFTVKAVEKIVGTSYKSTHVATFAVWPQDEIGEEWTDQAYVGVYRKSAESVKSASGLPTGIKFTAKDIVSKNVVTTEAHHFYGTPTKAGTYAVTLTHEDKSKTQFLWTITPAVAPTFGLELTESEVDPVTAKATVRVGVSYDWVIDCTSNATVTASGLPTGLKLVKTAIKSGTKTVGYAYSVAGVPTKAGEFFTTFTTKLNGVSTVTTAAFTVLDLPAWAQGTFDGGVGASEASPGGQATLTVSKAGKLSGKWMSLGTNWTLSATSYDRYDEASESYVAQMIGKTGSGKTAALFTNELTVAEDGLGGIATNDLFIAYQNNWKLEPWKTVGKAFSKAKELVFVPEGYETNDTVSLKFATSGKVTVKGKFVKSVSDKGKITWYSVSGSAVLCPQTVPDDADSSFGGYVFVYLPPKAKTPLEDGGYAVCVPVVWDGTKFDIWKSDDE